MRRLVPTFALVVALAAVAGTSRLVAATAVPAAPTGLHGFVHWVDDPVPPDHTYANLPAFAWNPVPKATSYDLELSTSPSFDQTTHVTSASSAVPAASLQVVVPWLTGKPYALWVHVRAHVGGTVSPWSAPFGLNTRWLDVPAQQPAPTGLIRWTPVAGATSYEVWLKGVPGQNDFHFSTLTNVADEREYWTFHPSFAGSFRWRVRAVRTTTSSALGNGIPITQYGPYSPIFTTTNPSTTIATTPLAGAATVSDVQGTPAHEVAHALTPGFSWAGTQGADGSTGSGLWRVYVYSDKQCVNQVMAGSVVGSPAWAPRNADPLNLPETVGDLNKASAGLVIGWAAQKTWMADVTEVTESESTALGGSGSGAAGTGDTGSTGSTGSTGTTGGSGSTGGISSASGSQSVTVGLRAVTLPDNGWPRGRYWWTVVPVVALDMNSDPKTRGSDGDKLEYHDTELPQDACAAGHVWPFGVESAPATTSTLTPFASGVVEGTRISPATHAKPSFQRLPLITWNPAVGATRYEVQVSRTLYPWTAVRDQQAVVPSAVLQLSKQDIGTWYYRVRGIDVDLPPAAQAMTWSTPVQIRITGDRFVVVK